MTGYIPITQWCLMPSSPSFTSSQPNRSYWSQLGEGGQMHITPAGATCSSTWAIPSLQPFPDEMSHGNKQHRCQRGLETMLHTEGQRRQAPCV